MAIFSEPESNPIENQSNSAPSASPPDVRLHLSACFDVYELPSGDSLLFAKDDYRIDCIPALVTKEGDVLGLAFTFKTRGGLEEGTHKFANGARGILRKGEKKYLYYDATGGIINIDLKHPIL